MKRTRWHTLLHWAIVLCCTPFSTASVDATISGEPISGICGDVTQIPTEECEALEALFVGTRGNQWAYNQGWLTSTEPCTWIGIQCQNGHVVSLSLSFNLISGSLPSEIGDLAHLKTLNLIRNKITAIPAGISELSELRELYLTGNRLRRIPPEIGDLEKLEVLHLSDNGIIGLPAEIGQLQNLQALHLHNHSLYEVPNEIEKLTNLRELRYSAGSVSAISGALSHLINLEVLALPHNQLTLVPPALFSLTKLRELDLSDNNLIDIPPRVGQLADLEMLNLSNNLLVALPDEIGSLKNLQILDVADNQLAAIPPEIGFLLKLERFDLSSNQLASIPAEVGSLADLYQGLRLGYNRLGELPDPLKVLQIVRPGWDKTQTVAPDNFSGTVLDDGSVELSWSPILFAESAGYYEVSMAELSGGPYSVLGKTKSKTVNSYRVPLDDAGRYYFVLRSYTSAHENQSSYLWSDYSTEATVFIPELRTNSSSILVGDTLKVHARGFPPKALAALMVNNAAIETVLIDDSGELQVVLGSTHADIGRYRIALTTVVGTDSIQAYVEMHLVDPDGGRTSSSDDENDSIDTPVLHDEPVLQIPKGLAQQFTTIPRGMTTVFLPFTTN